MKTLCADLPPLISKRQELRAMAVGFARGDVACYLIIVAVVLDGKPSEPTRKRLGVPKSTAADWCARFAEFRKTTL